MTDETTNITAASFAGQWVGETQGYEHPAHLWEIHQQGDYLVLRTRWEGDSKVGTLYASIVPGEPVFEIMVDERHKAILLDKQHFVVPNWAWHNNGKSEGTYDVVFSRPGIAELTAHAAYQGYLNSLAQTPPEDEAS